MDSRSAPCFFSWSGGAITRGSDGFPRGCGLYRCRSRLVSRQEGASWIRGDVCAVDGRPVRVPRCTVSYSETEAASCKLNATLGSRHRIEEVCEEFIWGVFALQRPAMLRYVRAMRGLSVEPPAESRPTPFGRGCQRLAGRSLRSRNGSPSLFPALSMLRFARAVPSEAACFAPHQRGFFFASLFVHPDALSRRASRDGRSPRGAESPVFLPCSSVPPLSSSLYATVGSAIRRSRRSGPCCRYATARPYPLACPLDRRVTSPD